MADLDLTPEQEQEARRIAVLIMQKAEQDALRMARLLVSKADHEILGETEFQIRDQVHDLGAYAIETAVNERKKRGTKDRAQPARTAKKRRGSSATARKRS